MDSVVTGFILRVVTYKESDAIITLLSKEKGIISFKARGLLKPTSKNSSACQLYTEGEYALTTLKDSDYLILTTANIIATLPTLYSDIQTSTILAVCAESILRIEEFSLEFAYNLFSYIFNFLKIRTNFLTTILVILKYDMNYLGIMLEANCCVSCGTQKRMVSVSYEDGGFLCEKCANELSVTKLSPEYLRNYRYVMLAKIENIADFSIDETIGRMLFKDFTKFLENAGGIKFKSLELVADLLKIHL